MQFIAEKRQIVNFKKWVDAQLPSCNDNDDPNHHSTVALTDPKPGPTSSMPGSASAAWLVPGVGVSL